jgi:hypothetical protein
MRNVPINANANQSIEPPPELLAVAVAVGVVPPIWNVTSRTSFAAFVSFDAENLSVAV